MDKFDEEIVKYLTHHKNSLWASVIVLTGGLVGLVLTFSPSMPINDYNNWSRVLFLFIGLFFLIAMFIGLLNTDSDIRKILKKG